MRFEEMHNTATARDENSVQVVTQVYHRIDDLIADLDGIDAGIRRTAINPKSGSCKIGFKAFSSDGLLLTQSKSTDHSVLIESHGALCIGINYGGLLKAVSRGMEYNAISGQSVFFHIGDDPLEIHRQNNSVSSILRLNLDALSSAAENLHMAKFSTAPYGASIDIRLPTISQIIRSQRFAVQELLENDNQRISAKRIQLISNLIAEDVVVNLSNKAVSELSTHEPKALRLAIDYIHAHLSDNITLSDLTNVTDVAGRTLQSQFQIHLGLAPLAFVRELRMQRARDLLCSGRPATVTAVAHACGITHVGRFAKAYHLKYGELPSQTLSRTTR